MKERKKLGFGWLGKRGVSGSGWGKKNYNQNVLYQWIIFSKNQQRKKSEKKIRHNEIFQLDSTCLGPYNKCAQGQMFLSLRLSQKEKYD